MRIAVGLSGGVDSSVAAMELKKKGHDVVGLTMDIWPADTDTAGERAFSIRKAVSGAAAVAGVLGIEHHVVDLSREFAAEVKDYFTSEYARGRTPNPCVNCNRRIKFGYLWKKATELGAEKIATGHYARIVRSGGSFLLAEAADKWQDQSYFLYDIPREMFASIEFPLGGYSKEDVKEMAAREGLPAAAGPSSQDICFVEGGDYRKFLAGSRVKAFESGVIVDVSGRELGRHKGIACYTVGQRHGLGIASEEPLYVVRIDCEANTVVVGHRAQALKGKIRVAGLNWLAEDGKRSLPMDVEAKIRYKSRKAAASISPLPGDEILLEFREPQFAPAPGQAAVFYRGETVLGGGWIEEVVG